MSCNPSRSWIISHGLAGSPPVRIVVLSSWKWWEVASQEFHVPHHFGCCRRMMGKAFWHPSTSPLAPFFEASRTPVPHIYCVCVKQAGITRPHVHHGLSRLSPGSLSFLPRSMEMPCIPCRGLGSRSVQTSSASLADCVSSAAMAGRRGLRFPGARARQRLPNVQPRAAPGSGGPVMFDYFKSSCCPCRLSIPGCLVPCAASGQPLVEVRVKSVCAVDGVMVHRVAATTWFRTGLCELALRRARSMAGRCRAADTPASYKSVSDEIASPPCPL